MESQKFHAELTNVSVPGNDTGDVLARFDDDVIDADEFAEIDAAVQVPVESPEDMLGENRCVARREKIRIDFLEFVDG